MLGHFPFPGPISTVSSLRRNVDTHARTQDRKPVVPGEPY